MEETPLFSSHEDDDEEDDDAKPVKKAPLAELFRREEDKEKASKDLAALLGLKKESVPKEAEDEPEASMNTAEQPAAEMTAEEEVYINRAIAEEHLEHPVTEDAPLPPVTDFLGLVVEGEAPATAYESTLEDNRLDDMLNRALDSIRNAEPVDGVAESASPAERDDKRTLPAPVATTSPRAPLEASSPAKAETKPNRKQAKASVLAGELAAYVIGQRQGSKKTREQMLNRQKKLEHKVSAMESSLADQEISLQQLSREKRVRTRTSSPAERAQPGRAESRLNLPKPERVGLIGKIAVDKERAPRSGQPRTFSSEQVRTMRRQDLLELSEKISVEGASLKHMFDNHLFGEGALRRLVEAHLNGRELMPLLRQEILERQIDYERDPQLRDRNRSIDKTKSSLFDQMLGGAAKPGAKDVKPPVSTENERKKFKAVKDAKQYARFSISGAILATTIVILIGLILYFVFE